MSNGKRERTRHRASVFQSRRDESPPTFLQRAKATLNHVRFSSGEPAGPVRLSPGLNRNQRQALKFWIDRMPSAFGSRLPPLKLAAAEQLNLVRTSVFINENPLLQTDRSRNHPHAVSFIPERYVVLDAGLFRRRIELGRILYHEFCHFIWPRLGNPKRRQFETLIRRELRDRVRGELGYSSEYRKAGITAHGAKPGGRSAAGDGKKLTAVSASARRRRWLDYVCESFCDTGSYILLNRERRKHHSEYTLSRAARLRRDRVWSEVVLRNMS